MKKKKWFTISIIAFALVFAILGGTLFIFFNDAVLKNRLFILMPCSYIGKQLEKEIPLGTRADDVVSFLKEHKEWNNGGSNGTDLHDYELYNNGVYINNYKYIYFCSFYFFRYI